MTDMAKQKKAEEYAALCVRLSEDTALTAEEIAKYAKLIVGAPDEAKAKREVIRDVLTDEEIVSEYNEYNARNNYEQWESFDDPVWFFKYHFPDNPYEAAKAVYFSSHFSLSDGYACIDGYGRIVTSDASVIADDAMGDDRVIGFVFDHADALEDIADAWEEITEAANALADGD